MTQVTQEELARAEAYISAHKGDALVAAFVEARTQREVAELELRRIERELDIAKINAHRSAGAEGFLLERIILSRRNAS
jgi:hypothetical protein